MVIQDKAQDNPENNPGTTTTVVKSISNTVAKSGLPNQGTESL